ncbi:MAG: signal peptidase I [Candidatus Lutibacillus vidarii]|jgi:signal peptidase I|nr:signal peptidase I [Dermatophilaceae bacterium]
MAEEHGTFQAPAPTVDPLPGEPAGVDPVSGDPHAEEVFGSDRTAGSVSPTVVSTILAVVKEIVIVVVMASVLSFVIKTWLVQAFYIPSGSMEDTLLTDDRVIVSKLTPGPFDLKRGDIVVFEDPGAPASPWITEPSHAPRRGLNAVTHNVLTFIGLLPDDSQNHLIKRVIGLPGDHVTCDGKGPIKVNGVAIAEPYLKPGNAPSTMAFDIHVPAGKVWVMGDHRSDSADSRWHPVGGDGSQGSVPIDKITGRAVLLVWPLDRWTGLGQPTEVFAKVPNPAVIP